jgi:signal transduction histidine kinase
MPHLFHAGFVKAENIEDMRPARWFVPLYFAGVALAIIPILLAGKWAFPNAVDPEMYVVKLADFFFGPLASGVYFLSSVWTAALLVTLATVALSGMLSHQFFQTRFMQRWRKASPSVNIGRDVMTTRRAAIAVIVALGLGVSLAVTRGPMLTNLGMMYASLLAQLLPALIGAVAWPRGHGYGVLAGLGAGCLIWLSLIGVPFYFGAAPHALFDLQLAYNPGTNGFVQCFAASMVANVALYVGVSFLVRPRLVDRLQAVAFIDSEHAGGLSMDRISEADLTISVGDLKALLAQFLGGQDAAAAFSELERECGRTLKDSDRVFPALIQGAERILAGVVGAPLAHSVMFWQLANQGQKPADVVRFLDETAQAVKLNREMLQATLNNLSQGVCVVDKDFGLVAWNARYVEIFDLGPGVIRVGTSLADIIRINRSRSGYSAEDTERYIRRRLRDVRLGIPHVFERTWSNGKTLRVIGMPMSDGRYVTSFTDVTSVQDVILDLRRANERLEERVHLRTMELTQVNDALQESTVRAERARASQARFLAAASHDLLQPLHAARLFLGALQEQARQNPGMSELVKNADVSIESANRLLNALLNLSRLEVGGVRPEVKPVDLGALLEELLREFKPTAAAKGLRLRIVPTKYWVMSDPDLLRSVLQNLVGNALRYTQDGAVLVVCRRDGDGVRLEVRDSGPGIPQHALENIFKEYFRLSQDRESSPGSGLGLSIVERICHVLHYPVAVRSEVGEGSTFMVTVPRTQNRPQEMALAPNSALLSGLTVLCVEHEPAILRSLEMLFSRWDVQMTVAHSIDEALGLAGDWDVVLTDYHFDEGLNGLDLIEKMTGRARVFALITADTNEAVQLRADTLNVQILRKPVAPAALRTFLTRIWLLKTEQDE